MWILELIHETRCNGQLFLFLLKSQSVFKLLCLPHGALYMRVVTTHVFPSPICFICYILGKFYLLPKIHKRTSNVPGSSVISNNGTATDNIFAFLDFHLKKI